MSFHLLSLQLGDEESLLERAVAALQEVEPGETAFLPEYLAWTPAGSGRAFLQLLRLARELGINIITTLNLGPDLVEDLPGRQVEARYNALVIFTRHGAVHVPQAKITTQSFEMDRALEGPGIHVSPYDRLNRVVLDVDDALLEARFLVCSDVVALHQLAPRTLRADVLVVLGNFAFGAERHASRLLGIALESGVARTAIHVNAYHLPTHPEQRALAERVEEVLDATRDRKPPLRWSHPRSLRSAFHIYDDEEATDFKSMCALPGRRGRVAVPRSRWGGAIADGRYPITIVL